jgi:hypothetical protein
LLAVVFDRSLRQQFNAVTLPEDIPTESLLSG